MEIAEIIKIGRELLKLMSENDVRIDDWKYLKMYDEFCVMRQNGYKYRYAVAHLASVYHISKPKIERIIRRLRKSVK